MGHQQAGHRHEAFMNKIDGQSEGLPPIGKHERSSRNHTHAQ